MSAESRRSYCYSKDSTASGSSAVAREQKGYRGNRGWKGGVRDKQSCSFNPNLNPNPYSDLNPNDLRGRVRFLGVCFLCPNPTRIRIASLFFLYRGPTHIRTRPDLRWLPRASGPRLFRIRIQNPVGFRQHETTSNF